ncbi:putative alanine aminotransferase, partial [Operophtera brumata]
MIRSASRVLAGVVLSLERSHLTGSRNSLSMTSKAITLENVNPNIVKLEYAMRGPLVIRAVEIEKELEKGAKKPFKKVIRANIGDGHAMGQVPITFIRQVLSCVIYPPFIKTAGFPEDVSQRARDILGACEYGN